MQNKNFRKTAVLFLILTLGFLPALSYACENGEGNGQSENNKNQNSYKNNDKREEQKERKEEKDENKSCRKAFKGLFKSGNLGNKSSDFYVDCLKPFGFEAKYVGTASSTPETPDTTAPVISDLSITPATTTATITWYTNERSDSTVFWSTSAGVNINSSSTPSASNNNKTKNHRIVLNNLTASTTYFVIVRSRDSSSNTAISSETSFKTKSPIPITPVPDTTSPTISNVVTQVSTSTIQVSWNTNEPANSKIYYSTSTDFDVNATSTSSFMENVALVLNHLLSLVGLLPQTVYHLIVQSIDGSGNATTTQVLTTTTTSI